MRERERRENGSREEARVMFSTSSGLREARRSEGRPPVRPVPGKVFVLARGGLRHMGSRVGRAGRASGEDFLGYGSGELFWKDVLDLVHPDEAAGLRALISEVIPSPGSSASVEVRMLDASGAWRRVDACVQNVLEAPASVDGGLLIVNMRDLTGDDRTDP